MNRTSLTALLSLLLTSTSIFAADKCTHSAGNMVVGKVTMQCLVVAGSALFNGTTIKGSLKVAGSLNANSAMLNNVDVTGSMNINNSNIDGSTKITGALEATDTSFLDKVQITAISSIFNHCITKNIFVSSSKSGKPAYLYLNNHSVVNGNITFVNGNGIVKKNDSEINGDVVGGKVE